MKKTSTDNTSKTSTNPISTNILDAVDIEYELDQSPEFILATLQKDRSEYEKFKKELNPLAKKEWPDLFKSIKQFSKTLKQGVNTEDMARGMRINRSLVNLSDSQDRVGSSVQEMISRVSEIMHWIDKQLEHNSRAQKTCEEYQKLELSIQNKKQGKSVIKAFEIKQKELIKILDKYEEYRIHFYHYFALYWLNAVFYYHLKS